jgi:plastocyanin
MKWNIVVPIVVVFLFVGTFVYLNGGGAQGTDIAPAASIGEKLVVSPQEARTSVTIDEATFTQGGFVVVRGSDGKRLGQVIEVSTYLEAGEYKKITIELGDFYEYNSDDQLIAMIYRDDGDQSFSDLDQPAEDTSGNIPAVFVKTGEPVPSFIFQEVTARGGTGMETVRYTNSGFQPKKLTVSVGTMVEFVNQSDKTMWVASNVHPEHEILPTFDQFKEVPKGQSYMYTFDKKGTWPYHDHVSPAIEGVITVE